MKRILILFTALALSLMMFVGCNTISNQSGKDVDNEQCMENGEHIDGGADDGNSDEEGQSHENGEIDNNDEEEEITTMYITINGNKLEVTLAKNVSVDALVEILKQGDIVYFADDYGGFEKVGNIGHTLPRSDTQITTEAGDVILYQGNQICLFVGSNSWSYTRIGKINGYATNELKTLLGAGKGRIEVRISLK